MVMMPATSRPALMEIKSSGKSAARSTLQRNQRVP
jgi:hypothetical protein